MWPFEQNELKVLFILSVSILGYIILRIFVRGKSYSKSTRCDGKVVVITGGNTGIGKETAIELAARGAKVYIACRSMERGEIARKEIIQESGSSNVFMRKLDLASFASIRNFCERFKNEEDKLHILINNAGILAVPLCRTEDGLEMQLGVNHFGHFLLTNLLLPLIKASEPSRIVNVSSMVHRWGEIKKHDLNCEKSQEKYPGLGYADSKLANILFTRELARRLKNTKITVNALHPGIINTEISRHAGSSFLTKCFFRTTMYLFNKTPKQGAQTTIYAALDPDLENVSGQYFSECGLDKISKQGLDDDMAKWLWNISEKWTKLDSKSQ